MKKEVLIISFPKCGRTWLTIMLAKIFQRKYDLDKNEVINLEKISDKVNGLPKIRILHEDSPQNKNVKDLVKIKKEYKNKKIIFLVRDPRDVIVSLFFHEKNRRKRYEGNLSNFLFRGVGDFNTIIEYYNLWADNKNQLKDFLIVKYEDLKKSTKKQLKEILKFIEVEEIDINYIIEAIRFASFKNMKKMELEGRFNVRRLQPENKNDPESFKVRRGKIGGYKDYLSNKEINSLNKKMENLSGVYRYEIYEIPFYSNDKKQNANLRIKEILKGISIK